MQALAVRGNWPAVYTSVKAPVIVSLNVLLMTHKESVVWGLFVCRRLVHLLPGCLEIHAIVDLRKLDINSVTLHDFD